jgi:short-subunit dehydrogenase
VARFDPAGATAILTGASSGIGRELAALLVARGTRIIANARREDRLRDLRDQLSRESPDSPQLELVAGDITDPSVRQRLIDHAQRLGAGRLDLLVNNAGIGGIGPFESASPERLRRIMEVNFFAPAELTRSAIPLLKQGRGPVICNISSVLGHRAVPNKSEYCASKFALHGWSDSLRAELYPSQIQVTLVSPSTTASEFFDAVIETEATAKSPSLGSWTPARVARAALSAILARRSEVILSLGGKALVYADRLSPPLMNFAVAERGKPSHNESTA